MNKKILKSLLVTGTIGLLATGATIAFFNDTETSEGNTFTAGSIDLKVDSEAHYNGLVCQDGVWTNSCEETDENLIVNGGFENPDISDEEWDIRSSVNGWTIVWESTDAEHDGEPRPEDANLEFHRGVNDWDAHEGSQYAELDTDWDGPGGSLNNEPSLVRISQDVATTAGEKYVLRYYFSPRPGTGATDNKLHVYINGSKVGDHSADGSGKSDTAWTGYTREFIASGPSTTVEFVGKGTANSLGVFLDDISLYWIECDSTFFELEGEDCDNTWEWTDLEPTHRFFDYQDVKPGDWGENTISLHVYDNDAYGCMTITTTEDAENDLIDPETEAGDDTADNGELDDELTVFVWRDDGDNIYEAGEEELLPHPMPASIAFNTIYPLATPANGKTLEASNDYYIGIAWCAGSMSEGGCDGASMGNLAQTDGLKVDLSFYVEQTRHNGEFTCVEPDGVNGVIKKVDLELTD